MEVLDRIVSLAGQFKSWLDLDFYEALLVGMLWFLAFALYKAHRNAESDFELTDILSDWSQDGRRRASLVKHFAFCTWFIHTWIVIRVVVFSSTDGEMMFRHVAFYAVLWAGLYLLGPVAQNIAAALVEKFTGVKVVVPAGPIQTAGGQDEQSAGSKGT